MSDLYNTLSKKLRSQFSQSQGFALSSSISLLVDLNLLLYGPGGYAKTDMVKTLFSIFDERTVRSRMLECNPDTNVSKLLGGAIAKTVSKEDEQTKERTEITREDIDYSRGPLENELFFLEETLDSPMQVLAALKALITNKQWDGMQSANRSMFGATNIDPYHLLGELPTVHHNSVEALLQRFLVIEHKWESHKAGDYLEMIEAGFEGPYNDFHPITLQDLMNEKEMVKMVHLDPEDNANLAQFCEDSAREGFIVSPRTYMYARRLLRAHAYIHDRDCIVDADYRILEFLRSFAPSVRSSVEDRLELTRKNSAQQKKLDTFNEEHQRIISLRTGAGNKVFVETSIAQHCRNLLDKLNSESFNESFMEKKEDLMDVIRKEAEAAEKIARESVKIIPLPES